MPVAAVVGTAEGAETFRGPGHKVRRARWDLLLAAGAQVGLRRRRPCHRAHPPVAVRVLLEPAAAVDEARLEVVPHAGLPRLTAAATTGTVAAGHDVQCRWRGAQWPQQADRQRQEEGTVPRYDVRCRACGTTFEVNRTMARADDPAPCPHGHDDTVRLLPTVGLTGRAGRAGSATATATAPTATTGGGCCGGACCG